jgi:hypothetical protein
MNVVIANFVLLSMSVGQVTGQEFSVSPDMTIQQRIASIENELSMCKEGRCDPHYLTALRLLCEMRDVPRRQFLHQLVYFASRSEHVERQVLLSLAMSHVNISRDDIIEGITPFLSATNPGEKAIAGQLLLELESSNGLNEPDLTQYADYLRTREGSPDLTLVNYMYDRSPSNAMLALRQVWLVGGEPRLPLIAHEINSYSWKRHNRYPDAARAVQTTVSAYLKELSGSDKWWIRLYVAAVLERESSLREAAVITRLASDESKIVRERIRRIK